MYWYVDLYKYPALPFSSDTDECAIDCICGGGKCIDFPAGLLYTCVCDDGFELTGDPAIHSRSCKGSYDLILYYIHYSYFYNIILIPLFSIYILFFRKHFNFIPQMLMNVILMKIFVAEGLALIFQLVAITTVTVMMGMNRLVTLAHWTEPAQVAIAICCSN